MMPTFTDLVRMVHENPVAFQGVSREECVAAARTYAAEQRRLVRFRHEAGESGANVLRMLTENADTLLRGIMDFGLSSVANRNAMLSRVSLCALGGYGRSELSPFSDLDVCLLYETDLGDDLKTLNSYLLHFLWDLGFEIGYGIRSIAETVELLSKDLKAFTCFLESRIIVGDTTTFARLKLQLRELLANPKVSGPYVESRIQSRYELLPEEYSDLYHPEPNIKENRGGLRDFHTALWLLMMNYGPLTLDDVMAQGILTADEHLAIVQALDVIWRIRNELHFRAGREDDVLTFTNQRHVARALGYGQGDALDIQRLMQDYYAAARKLRRFLRIATQVCDQHLAQATTDPSLQTPTQADICVVDGRLDAGHDDANWFVEQPARLMEVFWECARRKASLTRSLERRIGENLGLVTDAFRSSDLVRRFFLAICNRPLQAGFALRQAAHAGLLPKYLPEYAAIQGRICYEDFHHFPVDEHTLRAIEALALLPSMDGPVSMCLNKALEHLPDSYILVLAILFHDLGKAFGETHVQEGVRLAEGICRRIGITEEDTERITFLIENHLVMTTLSQYRDIDDAHTVEEFARKMKTEERLRTLFLLSYADLAAVGPGVWNDWKGALLMKLYLKTEKILLGRAEVIGEEFWRSARAEEIRACVPASLRDSVEEHLKGLGERYFLAFSPKHIAAHIACVDRAKQELLALDCATHEETNMSEVVVCTRDRQGLFSKIAGSFASQLLDVNNAALFTRPDGWVVDCFTVSDVSRGRPLTETQFEAFGRVLRSVLLDNDDIQALVDRSRRRLFALLQPRIPVPTRIAFDNDSSRTHTVIDVETGDRTGLLYDITRAMAGAGLDIATARIVTDARRVRDSFYVTLDRSKIEDSQTQASIQEALRNAIHPRTLSESRGGMT